MEEKIFHRRNLPHLHPKEGVFSITSRLADTLPLEKLQLLREECKKLKNLKPKDNALTFDAKVFLKYDHLLDSAAHGPTYLATKEVADIVKDSFHFYDRKEYDLICYCIMPNHFHLINILEKSRTLSKIMQSIKGFTAYKANRILGREGTFWQAESYDRLIRDTIELNNTLSYIVENPVKAGLVDEWKNWPYTYWAPS